MCFYSFSSFFQHFFLILDFHLDSTQIFQVHDMTINFSFVLFCFFHSHDLSTPGNDARHKWPSKLKHLFLCKDCFERVGFLVQSCLGHFCPKRGSWLQSILEKRAILINVPQGIDQSNFKISRSWDLVWFKGFGGLEAVVSLDTYQITKHQFFFKNSSFFVTWFMKNSRNKFLNQGFYGQLPEQAWSKCLFNFSKSCPRGTKVFKRFQSGRKYLSRRTDY